LLIKMYYISFNNKKKLKFNQILGSNYLFGIKT